MDFKEEKMKAKGKTEKMKEKYVEVKKKFNSEERKRKEEEEKITEKKKLKTDLKAATSRRADGSDDMAKALEVGALINWLKEKDSTISTLLTKIESLEKMEEEKTLMLNQKIQVLEAELCKVKEDNKRKAERICNLNMDLFIEKNRGEMARAEIDELAKTIHVLERVKKAEMRAMEDERKKKVSELTCSIEILEREKRELEVYREKQELRSVVCQVKTGMSEEINSILNEKIDLKEKHKEILNLVSRSGIPERELKGLLGSKVEKQKVQGLGCSLVKQTGTKRCKVDGLTERKLAWKNAEDLFNAFTVNDELCMRSVCALYRKYKSLGEWKNSSMLSSTRGFIQPFQTRGMDLGELLTSGDPEGRLKKSLAEFEQADPCGLEDCRFIAFQHDMELFDIYKNNLDPLFIPGDDMN